MKRHTKLLATGSVLSIVGAAGMAPTLYYQSQNQLTAAPPTIVTPALQTVNKPLAVTGKPVRLQIASLQLSVAVADGVYNPQNGQWTLSKDKAHFALITAQPNNEQGNTLIYGHYRPEVFARLRKLQPGVEAEVLTDNGHKFVYVYKRTQAVKPTDTSIFSYQGPAQLTLQTCSGAWLQNRQLYTFEFVRYEKL